jgi:general secretion pathway protein K
MNLPGRQRGVALIVVLMIFAMVFTLAVEILRRQEGFMTRTQNLINWDRRYQYAMAAEKVAVQGLIDDLEGDQEDGTYVDDCQDERWAIRLPPSPYEDALVSATVQDLQGRFNLNSVIQAREDRFLRDPQGRQSLERLLSVLLPRPQLARKLSFEMTDWVDSNNLVDAVDGAEDAEYRYRRTPNLPVAHESEFRALRSVTLEGLPRDGVLFDYLTALPVDTPLNLNTASSAVLDAVLGQYGGNAAAAVEKLRQQGAITDVSALFGVAPFDELDSDQRQSVRRRVAVSSSYFQVMIDVELDGRRTRLVTRIYRDRQAEQGGDERRAAVISRQLVPVLEPLEPPCNPHYNAPDQNTETASG